MLARSGFAEIVNHCPQIFKRPRRISPYVSPVGLFVARLEHGHRCLIRMQHRVLEKSTFERIDQWLQAHTADANPLGQCRARKFSNPGTPEDVCLAVQRQMVAVLPVPERASPPWGYLCQSSRAGTGAWIIVWQSWHTHLPRICSSTVNTPGV